MKQYIPCWICVVMLCGPAIQAQEEQPDTSNSERISLEQVVITATRTHLDRRESPVAVQVLGKDLLQATQSVSLAEGLNFRSGLRVEYNCQNCGFSQVRLNGLSGPYTQITIDGRPVFSALSGVYGLEQIPASMIERVEIVRGGGSSLYGGNAIAGTINLITREPAGDEWEVRAQTTMNGLAAPDNTLQGHKSWVNAKRGVQVWASGRWREPFNANPDDLYDRDGDGIRETADDFSEITRLRALTGGGRTWWRLGQNERLEVEVRGMYEHRRGGNRFDYRPEESDITEQLIHRAGGANAQYEWMSPDGKRKWSAYGAAVFTHRDSYYGAGGNDPDPAVRERAALYYGDTRDGITNAGLMHALQITNRHKLIAGLDVQYNQVEDVLPGYGRAMEQRVFTPAVYTQWHWTLSPDFTLQTGLRYDHARISGVNVLGSEEQQQSDRTFDVVNPRITLLYKVNDHMRFRTGWATGFRTPQAFDEDLHLSILGGAARMVRLAPDLNPERSQSYTLGAEWEFHAGRWEGRLNVDGFYTKLQDPFVNVLFTDVVMDGNDTLALVDTKVNDPNGASVQGVSVELQMVHAQWTIELGWTAQTAHYMEAREWFPGVATRRILRAPNGYGYTVIGWIPNKRWRIDLSSTLTGSMITPNERTQTLNETPFFADVNASVQRTFSMKQFDLNLEIGAYNLFNQYQSDLEVGWERDATYFYGPLRPFSLYFGLTIAGGKP